VPVSPNEFVKVFHDEGLGPFIGVPCSILAPILAYLHNNPGEIEYFNPTNEAHALGLATGLYLGSKKIPVVMLQNSGLGNIINPLTSLNQIYKVPVFLIVTWRGFGGVGSDAPEHDIVGRDLEEYLKVFHLPYEILSKKDFEYQIKKLRDIALNKNIPVAALVKKNFFDTAFEICNLPVGKVANRPHRWEAIKVIKESLDDFIFISTTGFTSRESFNIKDSADFYMLGSMGLASGIGCGVALAQKGRKVAILDGDGAILMHLGLIPFIGSVKPKKLLHFVLDNEVCASTQNQPTVSPFVKFDKLAVSCGYKNAYQVESYEELKNLLETQKNFEGPILVCVKVAAGNKKDAYRVTHTPEEIRDRFMKAVK
jgi:phosphonopyruvate decarboxylase